MSEQSDRGRPGRRRGRRGGGPGTSRKEREYEVEPSPAPAKPPIILAKPSGGDTQPQLSTSPRGGASISPTPTNRQSDKPVLVLKPREDERPAAPISTTANIQASVVGEVTPPPAYHIQRAPQQSHGYTDSGQIKLTGPPEMVRSTKLIDDNNQWYETAVDMLLDQTDFLVVGVLGPQGVGKSTLLSLLAGNSPSDQYKNFIFPPQSHEAREVCGHQTLGIDIYVTSERIIFLDAQPIMSASVLDNMIHSDKKYSTDYTYAENCIEMQSLQQATFLMTVCNVILVVQDWFCDAGFLRFLQTAEMLKPSTPPPSHDSSSVPEDTQEYYPHIVFLQNKAVRDDFSIENYKTMQRTLSAIFASSKLKLTGSVTMATGHLVAGLNQKTVNSDLNLFLLPQFDSQKTDQQGTDTVLTFLPEYRGYPSFTTLLNSLRSQVYSLSRDSLTHTSLSEKNWFHYAARTWDAVKKSQLMAEYNRLLP